MAQDSLANAKIKTLALVKHAPGVPRNMLQDALTTLYTDYLNSVQAFNELESSSLIRIEAGTDKDLVNGSDNLVYITTLGEVMLDELIKTFDAPSILELKNKGAELKEAVDHKALTLANYEVIEEEGKLLYSVHLSRKLPDSPSSIDLKVTVKDKEAADMLCNKWHSDKNYDLFNILLQDLGLEHS